MDKLKDLQYELEVKQENLDKLLKTMNFSDRSFISKITSLSRDCELLQREIYTAKLEGLITSVSSEGKPKKLTVQMLVEKYYDAIKDGMELKKSKRNKVIAILLGTKTP